MRTKIVVLVCALACVLASCTSAQKPHSRASGLPPEVTLYANNMWVFAGAARAIRLGFDAFDPSARVIVNATPDTATVVACTLSSFDAAVGDPRRCRTLASGVREEVSAARVPALAIVLLAPARATIDVVMSYDQADRHVRVAMPAVQAGNGAPGCADNGCNPFFEMQPVRTGSFTATATWSGPRATLDLLQGSVLGKSFSATGVPYRDAARADGASPLKISGDMNAPGEYALAFRQADGSAGPIGGALIDATWP